MNQENLKKLAGLSSTEELRRAIEALCRSIGSLKNIHLLPIKDGKEYLCFVEFDSPKLNLSMIEKLGGINFGNGVVLTIPNVTAAVHDRQGLASEKFTSNGPPNTDNGGD